MKALAIDSASSCMYISAKNDDLSATIIINIGMKQSQELLPSIDYVLSKVNLKPEELDYMTLCSGPGTFTGLRLAFSALKAIEMSFGINIYSIPSLSVYAHKYNNFNGDVVSVIDAKKDQFFASVTRNGKEVFEAKDTDVNEVLNALNTKSQILVTGPDAVLFKDELLKVNPELNLITFGNNSDNSCPVLFEMSEDMIANKKDPLKDFEGPLYLRKSEAELALNNKN